jgi:hypothetical protein
MEHELEGVCYSGKNCTEVLVDSHKVLLLTGPTGHKCYVVDGVPYGWHRHVGGFAAKGGAWGFSYLDVGPEWSIYKQKDNEWIIIQGYPFQPTVGFNDYGELLASFSVSEVVVART